MAAQRRGQSPLNLTLPDTSTSETPPPPPSPSPPPLSALFLIFFDHKAGYTIGWQQRRRARESADLELEGAVEYKSLPSGLHTVPRDLVYFVHGEHAGLSAFVNAPAHDEARRARMLAVGALVPLSYGRLGRVWEHADRLQELARTLSMDPKDHQPLEDFWLQHKLDESWLVQHGGKGQSAKRPETANIVKGHSRGRTASDGVALLKQVHSLANYHPVWSLPGLVDLFGPLLYPVQRAALLRKRILLVTEAPVFEACNIVYNISILSNIPPPAVEFVSPSAPSRLLPLFTVGVHDIPLLQKHAQSAQNLTSTSNTTTHAEGSTQGWIACTTDSILATKKTLYDILITMPAVPTLPGAPSRSWPKVETSQGEQIKATQRDVRQYAALRNALACPQQPPSPLSFHDSDSDLAGDTSALLPSPSDRSPSSQHRCKSVVHDDLQEGEMASIAEPVSWSRLAYSSFMWWKSAGEQRYRSQEEAEIDAALVSGLPLAMSFNGDHHEPEGVAQLLRPSHGRDAQREMAIVAYFQRLTVQMLSHMSEAVDAAEDDEAGDEEGPALPAAPAGDDYQRLASDDSASVWVAGHEIPRMGLDIWSTDNILFLEDMGRLYFERPIKVEGRNIDICGIRVC